MKTFANKTVFITGGTGTLGEKFVYKLIEESPHKIILVARNKNALLNLQRTAISNKIHCDIHQGDFLDSQFDQILDKIFSEPVHIVVQCAGYLKQQPFYYGSTAEIEKENQINYLTPVKIINKYLQQYCNNCLSGGRIINILSLAGEIPSPTMLGYSSSKAALKHFTEGLRLELSKMGFGCKIQNVTLGLFDSNMTQSIQKYKFVNSQCPDSIINSVFNEIKDGKENIMIGLYTIGAKIVNSVAPGIMKLVAKNASPKIDSV